MRYTLVYLLAPFIFCLSLFSQDLSSGLLERSQIPEKYKWNTSDVYLNVDARNADYLLIRPFPK